VRAAHPGTASFLAACAAVLLIASPGRAAAASGPVTIGFFVPLEGEDALAGLEARRGAEIAVARANRERRGGEPAVRLVTASSARPWGAGASALARLIYDERAAAVVGALDGRAAHVAEQVITRARGRAVFVTPWAAEPTLTRLRIPWFFSVAPDDARQAKALVEEIFRRRGSERALVFVEDSFDARAAAAAFVEAAPRGTVTLFASAPGGRAALAEALDDGGAGALVLFAAARPAADLAEWLNRRGYPLPLFGPLALTVPRAGAIEGSALEGMMVVAPGGDGTGRALEFARDFRNAYGSQPSPLAAYAHDAVAVVVKALRARAQSGGGATPLEAVLAATRLEGATGTVRFDARRGRDGAPALAFLTRDGLVPEAMDESPRLERGERP
jgi:branched-chain amino acid transport system substrate-binding protein